MASAVKARDAKGDYISGVARTDGPLTGLTDPKGDATRASSGTDGRDAAGLAGVKGDATSASDARTHWPLLDLAHNADARGCVDTDGRAGPCMPPDSMASDGRETGE